MRDLQMREIEERKKFETEQEKALDGYILRKIKEELVKEQQETVVQKKEKMEEMKKVMVDNEARKRRLLDMQAREKEEEIDLQRKAIQL